MKTFIVIDSGRQVLYLKSDLVSVPYSICEVFDVTLVDLTKTFFFKILGME